MSERTNYQKGKKEREDRERKQREGSQDHRLFAHERMWKILCKLVFKNV